MSGKPSETPTTRSFKTLLELLANLKQSQGALEAVRGAKKVAAKSPGMLRDLKKAESALSGLVKLIPDVEEAVEDLKTGRRPRQSLLVLVESITRGIKDWSDVLAKIGELVDRFIDWWP